MASEKLEKELLKTIEEGFERVFGKKPEGLELELAPSPEMGDFSVGFFRFSGKVGADPAEISRRTAEEIKKKLSLEEEAGFIESVEAVGPYLNIGVKTEILFGSLVGKILSEGERFGDSDSGRGKKVMVEYLSPNTNKPLHFGHLRNAAIGKAMIRILKSAGYEVVGAILINDRGIHICKSMLAYQKWGKGETPESAGQKGDHFVGKWYVRYSKELENNPALKEEAEEMLRLWEKGDPETRELWEKMNRWAVAGLEKSFSDFDLEFDRRYLESETYLLGKDVVREGIEKKVFRLDPESGAVVFDLPEKEFGKNKDGSPKMAVLVRKDQTSLYLTQDLGTTLFKAREFSLDELVWVVANEQDYHFKTLFSALRALGYPFAEKCFHLSYAMVYLPEGKMKSREGTVVDADDLLEKVSRMVREGIEERGLSSNEKELDVSLRSKKIALSALSFYLLRYSLSQEIRFDPKESIALEGFTGPYCQYAYVRTRSVFEKYGRETPSVEEADFSVLGSEEEKNLWRALFRFPLAVRKSVREKSPHHLAGAVFEISKTFNQFYAKNRIIGAEEKTEKARLLLTVSVSRALEKGLRLLGIETVSKM